MKHDLIVLGEALVDRFADGDAVGGAPLNVARHLAGFGFAPLLITRLGRDAAGAAVLRAIEASGLSTRGLQWDEQRPTGTVRVVEQPGQPHRFEILRDQAYDHLDVQAVRGAIAGGEALPLYYGTLAQRSPANGEVLQLLQQGTRAAGLFDLNWRDGQVDESHAIALMDGAPAIKLNDTELARVLRAAGLDARALVVAPPVAGTRWQPVATLLRRGRAQRLVVTYGDLGYAAFDRQGRCLSSGGAAPVEHLVDTVGAGDAFAAVLLAGALRGWALAQTLERASQFSAAICGQRGAVPADPRWYQHWRLRWSLPSTPQRTSA